MLYQKNIVAIGYIFKHIHVKLLLGSLILHKIFLTFSTPYAYFTGGHIYHLCLNLQKIRQYITPDGFFITVIKYGGGALQIVLGILFALAKGDFCGCVFETQEGELKLKLKKWDRNLMLCFIYIQVKKH